MIPFGSFVIFPRLLGKSPTIIGGPSGYWFQDAVPTVVVPTAIFKEAPAVRLKTPPNCQRSTSRETHPGAFFKSILPGPKGSSNVPLLRRSQVRWYASNVLFS